MFDIYKERLKLVKREKILLNLWIMWAILYVLILLRILYLMF